jgi:hypothetical protein
MDKIEKYIRENHGKIKNEELRKELVSQGYRPDDFQNIFDTIQKEKASRKRFYIILAIILIAAIAIRYLVINPFVLNTNTDITKVSKDIVYSSDPKDWIDKNSRIDVTAAANGTAYKDSDSMQYQDGDVITAFTYDGYYQGIPFEESYVNNSITYIEVTDSLNASDGVPQIMIVEKINKKNKTVAAMIFVDEDWKQKIVPTIIRWGTNFENNKIFDFSYSPRKGIYMDKIDDSERFDENFNVHFGGIAVGDITQKKIDARDNNMTYVRVR